MELNIEFKMNDQLFLRDPNATELGRRILLHGLAMLHELGLEEMTFKKLATRIGTTEASIYRYFENKHRLLAYFVSWHWNLMEYQIVFHTKNLQIPVQKVEIMIRILTNQANENQDFDNVFFDKRKLRNVVTREHPKVYLTKNIAQDAEKQILKPYQDLIHRIAAILEEWKPSYPHLKSLAALILETAYRQDFFSKNLPNFGEKNGNEFLKNLIFDTLR